MHIRIPRFWTYGFLGVSPSSNISFVGLRHHRTVQASYSGIEHPSTFNPNVQFQLALSFALDHNIFEF